MRIKQPLPNDNRRVRHHRTPRSPSRYLQPTDGKIREQYRDSSGSHCSHPKWVLHGYQLHHHDYCCILPNTSSTIHEQPGPVDPRLTVGDLFWYKLARVRSPLHPGQRPTLYL